MINISLKWAHSFLLIHDRLLNLKSAKKQQMSNLRSQHRKNVPMKSLTVTIMAIMAIMDMVTTTIMGITKTPWPGIPNSMVMRVTTTANNRLMWVKSSPRWTSVRSPSMSHQS